ncbi:MAG TPA: class I SAM-dependent methyltransferase [Streptosporangiaceae bacterium]
MDDDEPGGHPDRTRWNVKYSEAGGDASFRAHPVAARALALPLPTGPVLDLACGPSGSALAAATAGRRVTAVDISDVALAMLAAEARRRGLHELITLVHADLRVWRPRPQDRYALVLCTGYWDRALFLPAAGAVAAGGLLGWEAFSADARRVRSGLPAEWCLGAGEPASLLPAGFTVIEQYDLPDDRRGARRRLLARLGDGESGDDPSGAAGQHRPDDEDVQRDDQD